MLVRAFRLTDKFTNALLKLNIYLTGLLLERVTGFRLAIETTGLVLFQSAISLWYTITRKGPVTFDGIGGRRHQRGRAMVQRTQEQGIGMVVNDRVAEDPLLVRNRSLSALLVIVLFILFIMMWRIPPAPQISGVIPVGIATDPARDPNTPDPATFVPSATPTSQALSSVQGTLVFTLRQNGQDDIWALPAGSAQPVRLTDSVTDDRDPAISPDGKFIAFTSRRNGPWDLYVMDTQTGAVRRLTQTMGYEGAPTWSPDSQFIAYEGYTAETGNIDIYLISIDGKIGPAQFTFSPYPDLEPAWSPLGRDIAYAGYRDGNREILILNLDGQPEAQAINLSNTPDINESHPEWSPEGGRMIYSAVVGGVSGIYVKPIDGSQDTQLIARGQMAAWNPVDGASVFYVTQQRRGSALYLEQVGKFGGGANAVAFENRVRDLAWTRHAITFTGFDTQSPPLFIENVTPKSDETLQLKTLPNVTGTNPLLSDAVNDSYDSMRRRTVELVGYDLLGNLESTFWSMDRRPEPGQDRYNWHYTGRAISLNRNLTTAGSPPPIVVIREDSELGTTWRVMARVEDSAQNGALGEPLRDFPWDFEARTENPITFEQGGRLMTDVPQGYYVDLTLLMSDYGWQRVTADRTWRSNYSGVLFWQFEKQDDLTWREAMEEIYPPHEVEAFTQGATPRPPTPIATQTPTQPG